MSTESDLRVRVLHLLKPLHAVPIESPMTAGIPDVNCSVGWIELKHLSHWPKDSRTVVQPRHFKPEQRLFLKNRCLLGGHAWLLLRVGTNWCLVYGTAAAMHVGVSWGSLDLQTQCPSKLFWSTQPPGPELIKALVLRRWMA